MPKLRNASDYCFNLIDPKVIDSLIMTSNPQSDALCSNVSPLCLTCWQYRLILSQLHHQSLVPNNGICLDCALCILYVEHSG